MNTLRRIVCAHGKVAEQIIGWGSVAILVAIAHGWLG